MKGTTTQDRLWTGSFLRICLVNLFIFVNFHALLPTFPFFVTYLGGDAVTIGLATALFSIASIVSRPFVGWLIDTRGRYAILVLGLIGMTLIPMGYFVSAGIATAVILRTAHGVFHAASSNASSTWVTDIIPHKRMGEGLGMYGLSMAHIHRRSSCIRAGGNERLGIPTVVRHRCADGFGGPADRHGDSVPQLRGIRRPAAHSGAVRADVPACRRHAVLFHDGVWRSGGICGDLRHLLPLARRRNLLYLHRTGHRSHAYSAGACRRSVRRSEAGLHRQCSHRDRYSAAGVRAQRTVLPVVGSSAGLQFRRHPAPPYRRWRCTP